MSKTILIVCPRCGRFEPKVGLYKSTMVAIGCVWCGEDFEVETLVDAMESPRPTVPADYFDYQPPADDDSDIPF